MLAADTRLARRLRDTSVAVVRDGSAVVDDLGDDLGGERGLATSEAADRAQAEVDLALVAYADMMV